MVQPAGVQELILTLFNTLYFTIHCIDSMARLMITLKLIQMKCLRIAILPMMFFILHQHKIKYILSI